MSLVADSLGMALPLALELASSAELAGPDANGPVEFHDGQVVPRKPTTEERLIALGGYAVPAALAMLHDPRPVGRAYGCVLIGALGARAAAESLRTLFDDGAELSVDHWDYSDRTTVGREARRQFGYLADTGTRPSDRFERPLELNGMVDLVNGIRESSGAMKARSWAEWWDEARPMWNDWWRLAGDGAAPPDREAWWNVMFEYRGFRLTRRPNPEPRSVLTVIGPPGAICRVETDSVIVARGEPPLTVVREQDSLSVRRRTERDLRGDYSGRTFYVTASFPDGRTLHQGFFWSPSTLFTVELLAAPKEKAGARR